MEKMSWKRAAILTFIVSLLLTVIIDQAVRPCCASNETASSTGCISQACVNRGFDAITAWIAKQALPASIVLTFVLAVCAVLLIPASALTIASGAAFARALGVGVGVAVGSMVVFVGLSLGALMAFFVARFLLYDLVQRQLKRWRVAVAIDAALKIEGLKIMVLMRLSPLIPYNAFNYVIAATSVSYRDYSLALFAMLPATVGYVFIGASVADAVASGTGADVESEESRAVRVTLLSVGAVCTLLAVVAISCLASKHLKQSLHAASESAQAGSDS